MQHVDHVTTLLNIATSILPFVVPGAGLIAATIPGRYLGAINSLVQLLALNFGHAANESK
jgi:hypothetical protein